MGHRGPIAGTEAARQMVRARRDLPVRLPSVTVLSAPPDPPRAPRGLGADGRRMWRLVWTEAAAWLAEADRPLVERLAQCADDIGRCREAVVKHGPVVEEAIAVPGKGQVGVRLVANPALKASHDLGTEMAALATALGLSPASRARLGLTAAKTRSAIAAMQRRAQ